MKDNIIHKHISRCNRNLFLVNLSIILILFSLAIKSYYSADNGLFVPFAIQHYIVVFIGVVVAFFCLWNLLKVKKRISNPELHPISRSLRKRFAAAEDVASLIDSEVKTGTRNLSIASTLIGTRSLSFTSTLITDSWLLQTSTFGLEIVDLFNELIWIYKGVTKHSINYIPTGVTYSVILVTRYRHSIEISCGWRNKKADRILQELLYRAPWIIVGAEGAKAVDEKRMKILNYLKESQSV